MSKEKRFMRYDSPIGDIYAVCAHDGSCVIEDVFVGNMAKKELTKKHGRRKKECACRGLKRLGALLEKYFSGKRIDFDLPFRASGSAFEMLVWREIKKIPYGEVRTYGEIARRASSPKAFRAVGGACGRNPLPIVIPCHRVVSSTGLGGYSGGGSVVKKKLLRLEGALR